MNLEKSNVDLILNECKTVIKDISKLSRLKTVKDKPFKTINTEKMNYITENIDELNEKVYIFSKQNTQTTLNLLTLTMLFPADSVYRQLQQILAQVENKQNALIENIFKLKEKIIILKKYRSKIKKLQKQLQQMDELDQEDIQLEIELIEVRIEKNNVAIANLLSYIEAAIKEIGTLINSYNQIKKNKNVRDDWSELDVENAEIDTNIKNAFRNGLRDFLVHGRIGMGSSEYFEQLGISPMEAIRSIAEFLDTCNQRVVDYNEMYQWLNRMSSEYHDSYKKALEKIGLDKTISEEFLIKSEEQIKNGDSI